VGDHRKPLDPEMLEQRMEVEGERAAAGAAGAGGGEGTASCLDPGPGGGSPRVSLRGRGIAPHARSGLPL